MNKNNDRLPIILSTLFLIVFFAILFQTGCTDPESARDALSDEGYTDIEIVGFEVWGCSEDDFYHTGFRARRGDRVVEGVVCCGIMKDCTVRHHRL